MALLNWTWRRQQHGPLRSSLRGASGSPIRWGWLLLLLSVLYAGAQAQVPEDLERQVKAAYLYKFAGYVEWPDGSFGRPDAPLVIGVAGADALAEQLELSVAGRSVNGRSVQVRKVRRGEPLAGLHVLYLGALDKPALQEMLAASRGLALLTVSDSDEVYAMGSMINFVMADDKVRFDVALKPVAQAHIRISARMLLAAYRVQTGGA
ncbi:YfiR family protein [Janthinobacterium sp. HLX7-2]|uniref:YfiR family protein n=1 Tax=Janthinobacterium sp. HLX7-2 TaxID=1259331 RepID=UPI003F208FF7